MSESEVLVAAGLCSRRRGGSAAAPAFRLRADFVLEAPAIVGVLGGNGAGKTTLLDMIVGNESPASGRVTCGGIDVHGVHPAHRGRLVNHRRQRHHIRGEGRSFWNGFRPGRATAWRLRPYRRLGPRKAGVHLFDEPDLDDGYFGLLLGYMRELRAAGNLVLMAVHPRHAGHVAMLQGLCDAYLLVEEGHTRLLADFQALTGDDAARRYLGELLDARAA